MIKKLLSYFLAFPMVLIFIFVLGAFVGPKGLSMSILISLGEPTVKLLSSVFPDIVSDAFLNTLDPYSAAMGYISLVVCTGFASLVIVSWTIAAIACRKGCQLRRTFT